MSTNPSLLGRPVGANGEETRRRIIDATMRCVAEVGYERATIREIARKADMTSGSLYHYFPNKTELIKATLDEWAEMTIPRVAASAQRSDDFRERLVAVFDECDQLMREYPMIAAFDRAIRVGSAAHLAESRETLFSSLRLVTIDIIKQARREGALSRSTDIDSVANSIYLVLQGMTDYAATADPDEYHSTVKALKRLVSGTLFK
ncbi:TetR/AcrR family transcriptional regulator [Mycolicibacterium pyrenivorans]|uniref:TetR/AcrR family transcriptional regulator n=1 Tax=Mycolicibacterium pyrenivorans TaxID=187102 RepID=UPI0021F3AF5B|nr:TetR/AcrR family transcriptional regulator [Mycolicibacterium pyrenivorans]MCV7150206.1 TetR/AcrR family transcriptional regulator [Mycolicibacterium pyrenivorans]